MADATEKTDLDEAEEALDPGEIAAAPEVASPAEKGESNRATALVPQDSLGRYLAEIRRYPLLTPEEEHRLAVEFKEYGDLEAAYRLVTANLRLVVMIATRVPARVSQPPRSHPGGQHRAHGGGQEVRSLPGHPLPVATQSGGSALTSSAT